MKKYQSIILSLGICVGVFFILDKFMIELINNNKFTEQINFVKFLNTNITSCISIAIGIMLVIFRNMPINNFFGFKNNISKNNKIIWSMGNLYTGILCILSGVIGLSISLLIYLYYSYLPSKIVGIIGLLTLFSWFFIAIYVNYKLYKIFK